MTKPKKIYGKSRGVEVTDPRPRDLNQRAAAIVSEATDSQAQGGLIEISYVTSNVVIERNRFQQEKPIPIKKAAVTIT